MSYAVSATSLIPFNFFIIFFEDFSVLDLSETFYVFEDECLRKGPLDVFDKGMDYLSTVVVFSKSRS